MERLLERMWNVCDGEQKTNRVNKVLFLDTSGSGWHSRNPHIHIHIQLCKHADPGTHKHSVRMQTNFFSSSSRHAQCKIHQTMCRVRGKNVLFGFGGKKCESHHQSLKAATMFPLITLCGVW